MDTTDADDDQRFRSEARLAFFTALATFAIAGSLALLGYPTSAAGLTWFGGGSLLLSAVYFIMYRV